jgi:gliding motility-associated-like protein
MDILVAAQSSGSIFWYENDGSQTFTERTVSAAAGTPSKVYAMDIDGDGDQDVVSTSYEPVGTTNARLMWHENDGSENFTDRVIPGINGTSAYPIDVDMDGDVDLVATSEVAAFTTAFNNELLWFENDGSQNFTERIIDNTSRIQVDSYATDMDGDGDVDILMVGSLNFVGWFENDGSQNFTEHEIGSSESQPRSIFATDIDGDNDMDVLVTHELLDEISLWINDGSQNFTKQIVTTSADLAWDVYAADMDSDGDMDILSASRFGNELSWYENKVSLCPTPVTSNAGINQAICSGSSISISGVVTNTTSSLWSTSGDGTFTNAAMPVTSYTPGTSDISSGIVLLTLTANDPDGAGPCVAAASTISNTIDQSATVAVGNDISICPTDVVSLVGIIGGSASNQLWTSSGTGSFDDDTSLSATYTPSPADVTTGSIDLTLTVDAAGVCPQISDQLNVDISFCEIVAHNGISPNGDGLNDYFKIDNIELISPQNKVSIFTRWGDKVFEIENYDNLIRRFEGKSNSGKELSSGVYFYKIMLNNGSSEQTGYLTLKR